MTREHNDEYVICPHCGEMHGDCWEWVTSDIRDCECQNDKCGKTFKCYAEYDVTYISFSIDDTELAIKDHTLDANEA